MRRPDWVTTPDTLTSKQIESYRRDGFVRIPGVISEEEGELLEGEIFPLVDGFGKTS